MLSVDEFNLMVSLKESRIHPNMNALDAIHETGVEMCDDKKVKIIYNTLYVRGYVDNYEITKKGQEELEYFKVDNAIILAAGGSEMSAKLIYSLPKGLYRVNGTTLIERQIQQLKEIGINEIFVILGYKKEMYFYLEEKWGVHLVVNPCPTKNNVYSLFTVSDKLKNSYICNCDNYFVNNPFNSYEYVSYHATTNKSDTSREILISKNIDNRIVGLNTGNMGGECLFGHAFFNVEFSRKFRNFLDNEIDDFRVDSLFWEEFYARHIMNLDLYTKHYDDKLLLEFDSIQELQCVDNLFVDNISSEITNTICKVFQCRKEDIKNIEILDKGLSNLILKFSVAGKTYIFRYPGESTANIITRAKEVFAQKLVADLVGVDDTFVYIDDKGMKISRFVDDCHDLSNIYYKDIDFMKELVLRIRKLHQSTLNDESISLLLYNPIEEADRLLSLACKVKGNLFNEFADLRNDVIKLFSYTEVDGYKKVLSHNDINSANCLLNNEEFDLIDWEFAGVCDPAFDFGRVIDQYEFTDPTIDYLLSVYFGREATKNEKLHWIAYIAIHSWYYFCWCLLKESINEDTANWMYRFYSVARKVLNYVLPVYESGYIN